MDGRKAAGSVFMCQQCYLFSPSRSLLLAHCSQVHPQQEPPDDIIIALQPLAGGPAEAPAENTVKRKRGRPKGSTKKPRPDLPERKADSTHFPEDNVQREEEGNKEEDRQCSSTRDESHDRVLGLECRVCHRSFSNRRQILKHICLKEEEGDEEGDEESGGVCDGGEGSGRLRSGGADPNQKQQQTAKPGFVREKDVSSFRNMKTKRSRTPKEGGLTAGNKRTVISVVLTQDETLPGISKMVPVEDNLVVQAQPQSQDLANEATVSDANTDQETSCHPASTAAAESRGFQEYSIKQEATNLLQSQLKIFACEFCNKIFKFRHSLVAHLRTHTQEKPFQCPHCDYASAIKANLNVHLRKHTGEKFSCQHCPFNCLSPGHLKVHIERVHMMLRQHCSFCEKKYSDVKNLLKHMEKRHNLKDPLVHQSYQQLRLKTRQGLRQLLYYCPTCNRRFKNQLERERHLLVHGPQHPFLCLICDHAATKMATLTAHVKKHFFLYVCSMCDGKFVSSQRLKSHMQESHPELDQEQAFTDCISNSYYLIQPGRAMLGGTEIEDTEMEELRREQDGGETNTREEDGEQLKEATREDGEQEEEGEPDKSQGESAEEMLGKEGGIEQQERLHQAVSTETTSPSDRQGEATAEKSQDAADTCISAAGDNTQTVSSPENSHTPLVTEENTQTADGSIKTPLSSTRPGEDEKSPHSEKVSEVSHQSAFQQVFSSLQKIRLNMEIFQRLRKIYGDLECQYCGKLFWYKVHYNVHVRTHTKEHSHYCSKCSYSSITKSSLKRHQIQKHSGLLLPCSSPGCKYTTPDKYKLQAHLRTHQDQEKSVSCPVCQTSYPEHKLNHHIKTSHPESLPVHGKGLMVQRAEKCPYCDSYFLKNSSDFQRHIWAHQGLKPYVCTVCDYAGRSRSNLKTHMNRHNTERRHLCDLCGKKFKSKVTLKSHRRSHTDEGKQFQCSECNFTSASRPSLLRHMEQHAEFKPFRCAHCHYSCNIAGPLKRHYNLKHPDEKYQNAGPGLPNPDALKQQGGMKCPECDFVYGTKWELNRHLKSKHSLKVVEGTWEVEETVEAQYVPVEEEEQLTEVPVAALQDNVNIQQITEFSSETHDAVTSMVAMAPGTVTVVQQLQVADEQEVSECSNQLMVVDAEGSLTGDQVMVVEDAHGLEALTVLTQGENTHHYIVYVQEHTVEIN